MTYARTILRQVTLVGSLLLLPSLAAAQTNGLLYVTLQDSNAVAVVDTSTNTVVNTIQILPPNMTGSGTRPFAMAITPDAIFAYVVNESCGIATTPFALGNRQFNGYFAGTVTIVDISTPTNPNPPTTTINVGLCPTSIAITPDGKQAYISNYSDDTLSVIDTQTHAVTSIVLGMVNNAAGILVHDGPQDLAVNPKGGFVYLASRSGLLHKINTATNTVVVAQDLILVGGINYCTADRLALTHDGSKVFVTGGSCGSFEVLDGNLNYLYSPPQNTLCGPGGIKVAPDGGRAYLVDNECGSLYEIDTNNYSLRQSTPIPQGFPTDAMITTDSKQAYVGYQPYSSATLPGLWDIDTATLTVPATLSVPLGGTSAGMAFAPANNTPVGAPITVQPLDRVTGTSPVTVTFSQVTQAGFTGLLTSSTGFAPPAGFQLGSPAVYYDLTTTAQYPPNLAGSITVCINFTGISFPGPPALFHYESGAWVNQTTSVNNTTNTVCGTVSSLSPFTLFAQSASQTPLIITANNASRMYGQPDPALNNVIYSGFVNGDGPGWLSGTLTCTTGDTTSSPVGIYAINCSGLSSPNYVITYVPGILTITPAPLTVTANSFTRPYGANNPTLTGVFAGLLNGDSFNAIYGTTATPSSPPGNYPIVPAVAQSTTAIQDYAITIVNGTLTVLPEQTVLSVSLAPTSISVGQTSIATITLTAPDMVIPIDPTVLPPVTLSSTFASDILSNNAMCTLAATATPNVVSCAITITSVEPNNHGLLASFPGTSNFLASNTAADLLVTAALQGQTSCINSDFRNVAMPGGSYLWFNSIFKVRDVRQPQKITVSFYQSSVQFQYTDPAGNLVTVNQPMPDAKIVIDPSVTTASTTFDPVNNVWITTIPFDLDDNAFLTGLPWRVPSAGLPADVEPVTWCGTFASDTADIDIGWRWAAAAYSSFSGDNTVLGVKPMDTDHDNSSANHDRVGTPENFKTFVIPGARGKGGKNYTGSYSRSAVIE